MCDCILIYWCIACISLLVYVLHVYQAFQSFIDQSDLPVLNPVNLSG